MSKNHQYIKTKGLIPLAFGTREEVIEALRTPLVDTGAPSLRQAMLFDLDLSGIDFSGADLATVQFYSVDLSGANFTGAKLDHTMFSACDLSGATYSPEQMLGALGFAPSQSPPEGLPSEVWDQILPQDPTARKRVVGFLEADPSLTGFTVQKAINLAAMPVRTRADVLAELAIIPEGTEPCLWGWDLTGADLSGLDLSAMNITHAVLTGADLRGATLREYNLLGVKVAPGQLLDVKGLAEDYPFSLPYEDLWDEVMPEDPDRRKVLDIILDGWEGTLREALVYMEGILPASVSARKLLASLLDDWEDTLPEAVAAAELLDQS